MVVLPQSCNKVYARYCQCTYGVRICPDFLLKTTPALLIQYLGNIGMSYCYQQQFTKPPLSTSYSKVYSSLLLVPRIIASCAFCNSMLFAQANCSKLPYLATICPLQVSILLIIIQEARPGLAFRRLYFFLGEVFCIYKYLSAHRRLVKELLRVFLSMWSLS